MMNERFWREEFFENDPDQDLIGIQDSDASLSLTDSTERNLMNLWIDMGGEA